MSDDKALIAALKRKAEFFQRFVGMGQNETEILLLSAADALTEQDAALTDLGTAFRDYKIVHPEGTEDLHRKLAEQAATIEAALKVTDDMRSGGWHIGKTVPDLGEKLYCILTSTEGTR